MRRRLCRTGLEIGAGRTRGPRAWPTAGTRPAGRRRSPSATPPGRQRERRKVLVFLEILPATPNTSSCRCGVFYCGCAYSRCWPLCWELPFRPFAGRAATRAWRPAPPHTPGSGLPASDSLAANPATPEPGLTADRPAASNTAGSNTADSNTAGSNTAGSDSADLLAVASPSDRVSAEPTFGVDERTPWTTSRLKGSPEPPPPYQTRQIFANLHFKEPVAIVPAPSLRRYFVCEHEGKIFSFVDQQDVPQRSWPSICASRCKPYICAPAPRR